MEMHVLREEIALERQVAAGESEAVVEGSIALPGGLRQEAHVLYAGANATVESAEAGQDKLTITGKVLFRALYTQGDARQVRALEASADYTHVVELPGATARCSAAAEAAVRQVTAHVYSGQLTLRAYVTVQGRAMLLQPVSAVTGIADLPGLEVQPQQLNVQRTAAYGTADVLLREEFDLPASLGISETFFATATARADEVSGGAGRAAVSGTVQLEVWHGGGAGMPVAVTRHSIAFDKAVELSGCGGDELRADVTVMDVAVASQPAGEEERTLRAEVQLRIGVQAVSSECYTVLHDAFTTCGDALALTRERVSYRTADTNERLAESGKAVLLLPDDTPPLRQVLAVLASPEITALTPGGSRLTVEGTLHVTLLGLAREDDAVVSATVDTPFRQVFSAAYAEDDAVSLLLTDAEAHLITADRVELRFVANLTVSGVQTAAAEVVTDAVQTPGEAMNGSIVLYFVQPGDTLWSIARHYRVAEASIRALNPEMGDSLAGGQGVVVWRRCADDVCVNT